MMYVSVLSQSLQAHLEHLVKVFNCLKVVNLKLNHKKCRFMSEEIEYLGHIVTPKGLKLNTTNLDAVREFPILNTVKQLRLTFHCQQFVLNYASITQPLYHLTKQGTPFNWTASRELVDIICKAKQNGCHADALSRQPVLSPPMEDDCAKEVQGAVITSREFNSDDNTITVDPHKSKLPRDQRLFKLLKCSDL